MKPSTHKVFVFAGFGCGGLFVALVLLAILAGPHDRPAPAPRTLAGDCAPPPDVALDSLTAVVRAFPGQPARNGAPREPHGAADGATRAVALWRSARLASLAIAFGDTFPAHSTERTAWLAAGASEFVDTLVAAAQRPWRLAAALPDTADPLVPPLHAGPVLSAARAMLARAVLELESGRRAAADTTVQAVESIGLALWRFHRVSVAALGARIVRDAAETRLRHRALWGSGGAGRARAALAHADSVRRWTSAVLRLTWAAAAMPASVPQLAALAADSTAPLAVRVELVEAIAGGWVANPEEVSQGIARRRRAELERLERDASDPGVRLAAGAALARKDPFMVFGRMQRMMTTVAATFAYRCG